MYHQMSVKHLQRYVNEFTFRLNEADCGTDTIDQFAAMRRNGGQAYQVAGGDGMINEMKRSGVPQ